MITWKKLLILLILIVIPLKAFPQSNIPEWAKGIVWYQIFPERFANGDFSNDPTADKVFINDSKIPEGWKIKKWTSNWFAQDKWEKKLGGNLRDHLYERRYGGDIQGIIDHLDYLKELGIGAIYLNPIFEAASLHKYDGSSYHHIDINFGPDPVGDKKLMESETPDDPHTWVWTKADKLFLKLIQEVHKRGMKIIIDGVFNHTGTQFWAFQDIEKNGSNSKYKSWYQIKSFDDPSTPKNEFDYKGWWNIKSLPEFSRSLTDLTTGPKQYIFNSTHRWMDPNDDGNTEDGIDGWRLDVAREVPKGFWNDWSHLVKSINKRAVIIGELWELSADFVSENGPFDGLMNYNFAYAVNEFFVANKKKISTRMFIDKLKNIIRTYPQDHQDFLQNLMDSHDTERLSSLIQNPDRNYDRDANEDNPNYNPGKPDKKSYEMQKLIAAFQIAYRGAPMIYYGDEVGMWGADDPHDRKPMVWSNLKYDDEVIDSSSGFKKGWGQYKVKQDKDLFAYYKKIISIRNNNTALQKGNIKFLYSNDSTRTFAFERNFGNEQIIAVFNIGNVEDKFDVPVDEGKILFTELISGEQGSVSGKIETGSELSICIPGRAVKLYKLYLSK